MKLTKSFHYEQLNRINLYSSIALCIMMICIELGNKHSILGVRLSYWGCLLFIVALIIDGVLGNLRFFSKQQPVRNLQVFLLVWLSYGVIQAVIEILLGNDSLDGMILLCLNVIVAFFLLVNCNSQRRIIRYIDTVSIILLICILISIWEIRTGNHLVEIANYEKYHMLVFATFYNQNDYCTLLCLGIILQILGVKLTSNKIKKCFYIIISVLAGYMAYRTESRASYICLVLFFALWIICACGQKLLKQYAGILLLVLGIGCFVFLGLAGKIGSLIYMIDPDRFKIYSEHIALIGSNFMFGYGPMMLAEITGNAPHNLYIEFWGDFGLILFSGFVYFTLFKFVKAKSDLRVILNPFFFAFALMLPILGCSSSNIQRIRIFWISISICYATAFFKEKRLH